MPSPSIPTDRRLRRALRDRRADINKEPRPQENSTMHVKRMAEWALVALLVAVQVGAAGAAGGGALLVDAVKSGDVAAVRALLKRPGSVNVPEADGTTALHWATDRDEFTTAQLLVRAGANVRAANRYGV